MRHAFDDGGTIRVFLEDISNGFLLRVSDNGGAFQRASALRRRRTWTGYCGGPCEAA
ncbi:hypothetical protein [Methanothermobacter sp.]|uniref:hypothetical protein n=1 Tax=Methanothermobacter sp. TaxID=1884223 RepID=UPI00345BFF1A